MLAAVVMLWVQRTLIASSAHATPNYLGPTWSTEYGLSGVDGTVKALASYGERVVAGGEFLHAGASVASRVAEWDGQQWGSLGDGFDDTVLAFTIYNEQLIAGGAFLSSGSSPIIKRP